MLEAHLLDFEGDLYGQTIEVELLEFLREERRFGSTEELSRQIEADKKRARERPPPGLGPLREAVQRNTL